MLNLFGILMTSMLIHMNSCLDGVYCIVLYKFCDKAYIHKHRRYKVVVRISCRQMVGEALWLDDHRYTTLVEHSHRKYPAQRRVGNEVCILNVRLGQRAKLRAA